MPEKLCTPEQLIYGETIDRLGHWAIVRDGTGLDWKRPLLCPLVVDQGSHNGSFGESITNTTISVCPAASTRYPSHTYNHTYGFGSFRLGDVRVLDTGAEGGWTFVRFVPDRCFAGSATHGQDIMDSHHLQRPFTGVLLCTLSM